MRREVTVIWSIILIVSGAACGVLNGAVDGQNEYINGKPWDRGNTLLSGHKYLQITSSASSLVGDILIDDEGRTHALYAKANGTKYDLIYKRFAPDHTVEQEETVLHSPSTGWLSSVRAVLVGTKIHIGFSSNATGNYDVYYMLVQTNGTILVPAYNLINNFGNWALDDNVISMDFDAGGNVYIGVHRSPGYTSNTRGMITRVDAYGNQVDWTYRGSTGKIFYVNGDIKTEGTLVVCDRELGILHIVYADFQSSVFPDVYYLSINTTTGNTICSAYALETSSEADSWAWGAVDANHKLHLGWIHCVGASGIMIWGARISSSGTLEQTMFPVVNTPSDCNLIPVRMIHMSNRIHLLCEYDYPSGDSASYFPYYLALYSTNDSVATPLTKITSNLGRSMDIEKSPLNKLHIAYTTGLDPPVELGISYEPFVDPAVINFSASELQPYEGLAVNLTGEIGNLGYDVLDTATVSFYENPPEQGGALIASTPITNLAGGAKIKMNATWVAKQGYYNLTVIVSAANPSDSNNTNNRETIFIYVGKPDLEIAEANITLSNTAPVSGELLTITAKVNNLGDGKAVNPKVRFYLDGILLGTDITVPEIKPRNFTHVQAQWIASSGTHTLLVYLDPANLISEENETNNNATKQIYVDSNLPDFVAVSIVLEAGMVAGTPANATLSIANAGNGSATAKIKVVHNTATTIYTHQISAHSTINLTHQFTPSQGTSTIEVFVDPEHEVMETEENNNYACTTFTLLPDIEISTANITHEIAEEGRNFNLSAKVHNLGGVEVHNVAVAVLENNATVSEGYIPDLPAYSFAYYNFTYNTVAGWHLFRFVLDGGNTVVEANETNNEAGLSLSVTPLPDLVVQGLSIGPSEIDEITEIMVRVTVVNNGSEAAHNFSISFYLDGAEFEVDKVSTLNPNEGLMFTGKCVASHGPRTVTVKADPDAKIHEISEANNEVSETVEVAPLPDLGIENFTVTPEKIDARTQVEIKVTVKNYGWATATNITVGFYIDGVKFETLNLSTLAPGQNTTHTLKCTLLEGTRVLTVKVDPESTIKELSEENNEATTSVEVAGLPDLVMEGIEISPGEIDETTEIMVNATLSNIGSIIAENFTVSFRIDGVEIATSNVSGLDAGKNLVCVARLRADPGTRVLAVKVDSQNTVKELSEANNEALKTFEVMPLPDLAVENAAISGPPFLGFEVQIAVNLTNGGHGRAENITVEILDGMDVIAGTRIALLNPGERAQVNLSWTPETTGSILLTAIVDRGNAIRESNETNNGFQMSPNVTAAVCDVGVEVKVAPEGLRVLAPAEILITLRNSGSHRAEVNLSVYIDEAIYDTRTIVLEPGSGITLNLTYIWLSSGTKKVRAEVQLPANLSDNNISNNVATESVAVAEEPGINPWFIWLIIAVLEAIVIVLLLIYIVLRGRKPGSETGEKKEEKAGPTEANKPGKEEETEKKKY